MSKGTPRPKRMNRAGRLQSAKHWLPTYTGRDIVKGYRNWYGVSTVCAIIELRQLGVEVDELRFVQAKRTEEEAARRQARRKQARIQKGSQEEALFVESEVDFDYIGLSTDWGFPFGVTREELEAKTEESVAQRSARALLDCDDIPF